MVSLQSYECHKVIQSLPLVFLLALPMNWTFCPDTGLQYTRIDLQTMDWNSAKMFCESLEPGAHLATPRSSTESNRVHHSSKDISKSVWIGLLQENETVSSAFIYVDDLGVIGDYSNWTVGEPDISTNGTEKYCVKLEKEDGVIGWGVNDCLVKYEAAVCQRSIGEWSFTVKSWVPIV